MADAHKKLVEDALAAQTAFDKIAEACTAARKVRDDIWRELWDAFYPGMKILAGKHGAHNDDVEDVVQEAFKEAWASLASLREPRRFPGFLATITARKAGAIAKKRSKHLAMEKAPPPDEQGGLPARNASEVVESGILAVALRVLEKEDFTIFFLHCCWELEFGAIHEHGIGTNENAVRAKYQRAKQKLQQKLRTSNE